MGYERQDIGKPDTFAMIFRPQRDAQGVFEVSPH